MVINVNNGKMGDVEKDKISPVADKRSMGKLSGKGGGLWGCKPDATRSWEQHAIAEFPGRLTKEHAEVTISDKARVLVIDSRADVDRFFDRYDKEHTEDGFVNYAEVARDYDVIDYHWSKFDSDCWDNGDTRLHELDCDCVLVLNKDVITDIKNPETLTFYTEEEERNILNARYSEGGDVGVGLTFYHAYETNEQRIQGLNDYYRIYGKSENSASAYTVVNNYGRLKEYIDRNNGRIDEKQLNKILVEVGIDKNAEYVMADMLQDMSAKNTGMEKSKVDSFKQNFDKEYIHGCRPWRLADLKIRDFLFKLHRIDKDTAFDVKKECLRCVLNEPSNNTWNEMSSRIPAIAICLSK